MSESLLSTQSLVQAPVIQVTLGGNIFGVHNKEKDGSFVYPNYVQSLEVTKINGQVNTYNLVLNYPINENSDPNYFEKIFSSISESRKIKFTYGDACNPRFLYKEEEALIINVKSNFMFESSCISYTISAISESNLGFSGVYNFDPIFAKPSDIILRILKDPLYQLQSLFTGMMNLTLVESYNLIPHNDVAKDIEFQENISVLAYLEYLVSLMSTDIDADGKSSIFIMTYNDDTSGVFHGSYFKIVEVDQKLEHPEAYQLDIGYPGSNYVYNFNIENDETYALYYSYQNNLHPQQYAYRVNADGDIEETYAPTITSNNSTHSTHEDDKTWWAKVTQYPIKASVTIKGLLRPAILMTYVRLNVWLFGKKHINSGLYIITKQVDKVDGSGYQTTLNLMRISGD